MIKLTQKTKKSIRNRIFFTLFIKKVNESNESNQLISTYFNDFIQNLH